MGRSERRKGYRVEYELVKTLRKLGFEAKRVPLSGSAEGFKGDVIIILNDTQYVIEVKARKEGFKEFYKWLENKDMLVVKANRKPYLIIMPLETFAGLFGGDKDEKND